MSTPSFASATPERSRPRLWNRRVAMLSIVALTAGLNVISVNPSPVRAADPVAPLDLGLVETFGVLTPAAVGNAANVAGSPPTMIRGDLGAGGAVTGFAPGWGVVTGTIYDTDPAGIAPAMADLQEAYNDAWSRPNAVALPASLAGMNFTPGVYSTAAASGTAASTSFTIDGEGNPDSVFIFRVGGALNFGASTSMTLVGEAQAKNVFWVVGGAGGLGAPTEFVGTLIATTAVAAGANSIVNGRLLSLGGAVTMGATQLYSAPPAMSIDGGDTAYTTSAAPVITGVTSARAPMTVIVSIDGVDQTPALTPSAAGIWSYQSPLLANGAHTIGARSVDGAGNVGSDTQILTVDTTPPAVTINGGASAATNNLSPTISGDTDIAAGRTVHIELSRTGPARTLNHATLVQADNTWNFTPTNLTPGEWSVVASVSDPAGNPNSATQTLMIDATAPSLAITSNAVTNDPTPTISGTTEQGATVAVSMNGLAVDVSQGANWSATSLVALAHGNHNVSVTSTDAVGNSTVVTQTLNVDLVLPVVTINPGPTDSSSDSTPTIAGTADVAVGSTVHVSINGAAPLSALVQVDGWNVTPSTALAEGVHTVVASVSDPADNVGTATQMLTVDTSDPTVVIDGGPSRTTADRTPTITGVSLDVPVGSPVSVQVDGQTLNTTIAADGTFSVTAAEITPNGTYFVFVTVTDVASNDGSANQSLTINAVAPTVTFTNGATASTNDTTPLITGSSNAPVGSPVVVTVAGQTLNATVQPGGSWMVNAAALSTATHVVFVSITNADGNVGSATQDLNIDSTTPTAIAFTGGANGATNDTTPTIAGTTDAADGRVVTVQVAGQTLTAVAVAGTWSVTAAHLNDGIHQVTASLAADGANPGSATQSLTVDTVAPVVVIGSGEPSTATTDPTPDISGSGATPGSAVTVVVAGQAMTTTVTPAGTWTVTPLEALHAGDNVVTVTIVDPAGNSGTGTQTVTVIVEATTITVTGGTSHATNDNTPTISGVTNAADGRVLTVTVSTQTLTTTVAAGTWSVTTAHLADGTYNVVASVSVVDGAAAASTQSLTVDTVAPEVVVPPPVETTDPNPAITGSDAPAGSTVTVTVAGETLTTTVGADGTWSVTPTGPLPAGEHTVTITIVDPAGNTGTGTQSVTVTAPPTTTTTPTTTTPPTTTPPTTTPPPQVAEYTSVGPKRVFDTRPGASANALRLVEKQRVSGGYELRVQMTHLAGFVPASGVGAVSLNVTATGSTAAGFVTVYACGAREEVSSVNYAAGQTVANAVIAPVAADGSVCFFSKSPTHLVVDINGWFAAGEAFNAVGPKRVFDTRPGASSSALRVPSKSKLAAGTMMEVRLTDLAGYVPAAGVGAVSLNVVVTNPEAAGFITVYSCGTLEEVSSVNYTAGQTVANAVVTPVSASGTVCFFSKATTDLVVDINGWIEAGSSFHALSPARVLDTRPGASSNALRDVGKAKIGGGNVITVKVADLAGRTPANGVSAVSLNVTATDTEAAGFITVFSCGNMEEVSSLNFDTGQTVANAVLAPVSAAGTICLFASAPTHVIVDINAWVN